MKIFPFITAGRILLELKQECGLTISRPTLYRAEKKGLFISNRNSGKWRVYSREEADVIKALIKEDYKIQNVKKLNKTVLKNEQIPDTTKIQ